ncbi:hypothetical protein [Butyrivibrio sp. AE3004]|uniref:hypothetical protein n=1 Tax=Butyrivibrio sp. AE3004 TaxID=1506994 RepID=UPI00049444DB|nr:hypothetical protein [Butyrivibrio sp. AE3004]
MFNMDSIITVAIIILFVLKLVKPVIKAGQSSSSKKNVNMKTLSKRFSETKYAGAMTHPESSAMPHKHWESGSYDTANRHRANNSDGTIPHSHNEVKLKHIDVATLPKGYILLNGEPVRTKDLENY